MPFLKKGTYPQIHSYDTRSGQSIITNSRSIINDSINPLPNAIINKFTERIIRNDLPKFYDTHYMMPPISNREISNNRINQIYKISGNKS